MYTANKNGNIIIVDNLTDFSYYFNIEIKDDGKVYFNGKLDTISYNMKEWDVVEATVDFIKTRLPKFVDIYKAEKL